MSLTSTCMNDIKKLHMHYTLTYCHEHNIDIKIVNTCNYNKEDFDVYLEAHPKVQYTSAAMTTQKGKLAHYIGY